MTTQTSAFSRLELIVVISVLSLLVFFFLVLPFFGHRAREKGWNSRCLNNLHQLGAAVYLYADDHNRRLPAAERQPSNPVFTTNVQPRICELLTNYLDHPKQAFICPKDHGENGHPPPYHVKEGSSYEWNYSLNGRPVQGDPLGGEVSADEALMYDYENVHRGPEGNSKNILFADGRVARPLRPEHPPGMGRQPSP